MGIISTEISKSSFSKKESPHYKLSILIGMDSLSYCIVSSSDELLVLKKIRFESSSSLLTITSRIKGVFDQEPLFSLPYKKTSIYYISKYYTIIPDRLYSFKNKEQYLTPLKRNVDTKENYLVNSLPSIQSKLIYTIPATLQQLFDEIFGDSYNLKHSFSSFIEELSSLSSWNKEIYINVRDYSLQAFFFDNKALIFSNLFDFQSDKDFIYYVLLLFDQFKLNPMEVPVKIAGSLSQDSKIYNQLHRYIQHISFIDLPKAFRSDLDLKEHPPHLFFDILHAN